MFDLDALHSEAQRYAEECQWGEAARAYARLATGCQRAEHLEGARWAWDAAGEAWRRHDQPVPAARALRMAIALGDDDDARLIIWSGNW